MPAWKTTFFNHPYNIYVEEKRWYGSRVMRFLLTLLPQGTQWWVRCRYGSVVEGLYVACRSLARAWQTTASILINYILTGERTPPRLTCKYYAVPGILYTPLLPPYLSAEAVTRIWQAMRFKGNAKSWALRNYWLTEFNSYAEALEAWNLVAPAEWKIGSYRQFYTEWKRAQRGSDLKLPHANGMCRESLEFRLAKSFGFTGILEEIMATVEPPDSVETY